MTESSHLPSLILTDHLWEYYPYNNGFTLLPVHLERQIVGVQSLSTTRPHVVSELTSSELQRNK